MLFLWGYLGFIAYVDMRTCKIYNKYLVPLLLMGLGYGAFIEGNLLVSLKGLLFGAVFFFLIYLISKGGLGEGDVKLFSILGLFLGPYRIGILIFLACILQLAFSLVKGRSFSSKLPFAPSICLGFFITFYWGIDLLSYLVF